MKFNKKQATMIEERIGRTLSSEEIMNGKVELTLKTIWKWMPDATAMIERVKWLNESYICISRKANNYNDVYGYYSGRLYADAEVRRGLHKMLEYWTVEC